MIEKILWLLFVYILPVIVFVLFCAVVSLYILFSEKSNLYADMNKYLQRSGKSRNFLNIFIAVLGNNGIQAIVLYRIAFVLNKRRLTFIANGIRRFSIFFTGIDIAPSAVIGKGFEIYHGQGLVIGKEIEIGENVLVCHEVTIGYSGCHRPVIADNVKIFAGAKIIGDARIGQNCKIGANAVVTYPVPANSTVACQRAVVVPKVSEW